MRTLILTALLTFASAAPLAAQAMPTMPPSTYPETGTFCGFLTLCPKVATKGND